jgi:hypothetical protein
MDHQWREVLLVLMAGMVIAGCSAPSSSGTTGSQVTPTAGIGVTVPLEVMISAEPPEYSPFMSTTPGMRLSALNTSGILPPGAVYRWETSYGYFLSFTPPVSQVVQLGPVYQDGPEPVYWTFDPIPSEQDLPEVVVTLAITDSATGAPLAQRTLQISWKDRMKVVAGHQS